MLGRAVDFDENTTGPWHGPNLLLVVNENVLQANFPGRNPPPLFLWGGSAARVGWKPAKAHALFLARNMEIVGGEVATRPPPMEV